MIHYITFLYRNVLKRSGCVLVVFFFFLSLYQLIIHANLGDTCYTIHYAYDVNFVCYLSINNDTRDKGLTEKALKTA